MAAPAGFKFSVGEDVFIFNTVVSEDESERMQGPNSWLNAVNIFKQKVKTINLGPTALDAAVIGGYPEITYEVLYKVGNDGVVEAVEELNSPSTPEQSQSSIDSYEDTQELASTADDLSTADDQENLKRSAGTKWTDPKVKHLIQLQQEYKDDFNNNLIKKKNTWQKVAEALNATGGAQFTAEEADKKWRSLKERYKKIKHSNSQTGRGRSTWVHFEDLAPILERDPSINPPCQIAVGAAVVNDRGQGPVPLTTLETPATPPESASPSGSAGSATTTTPSTFRSATTTATPARKRKGQEMPTWASKFLKQCKKDNKRMRHELQAIAHEEQRRNNLFEEFLDFMKNK